MFGTKITHVFRSRWHALMWSAGVLATAYCSLPAQDNSAPVDPAAQQAADQADAAQARQIVSAWTGANKN